MQPPGIGPALGQYSWFDQPRRVSVGGCDRLLATANGDANNATVTSIARSTKLIA
jgi:hypothetical protein